MLAEGSWPFQRWSGLSDGAHSMFRSLEASRALRLAACRLLLLAGPWRSPSHSPLTTRLRLVARGSRFEAHAQCFTKCVTRPSTSLSGSEERCLTQCMQLYMAAFDTISRSYVSRISKEGRNQKP